MNQNRKEIFIFDHEDALIHCLLKIWQEISKSAMERKGTFVTALSGGETPIPFYQKLSEWRKFPWDKTHFFLVDERFTPFSDPDNNYRMLQNTFLREIKVSVKNIHPIPVEEDSPQSAARKYEEVIKKFFKLPPQHFPEFDLILLGIGEDGHTASLFPGSPVLKETRQMAAAVLMEGIQHPRITLTLPVINQGKNVLFLVTGKKKATIVEKVVHLRDPVLPASGVAPEKGKLFFLLDREAGSLLTPGENIQGRKEIAVIRLGGQSKNFSHEGGFSCFPG